MNYRTSAFYPDELTLSKWDLIKLFFGYTFQVSGLIVTGNPFYKSPRAIKEEQQNTLNQQLNKVFRQQFERAPCFICGYNGHSYFKPEVHPCAKQYHEINL